MWNVAFRPISSDDYDLRWSIAPALIGGSINRIAKSTIMKSAIRRIQRSWPDRGRSGSDRSRLQEHRRYFLSLLYPVLAPQSDRGAGFIRYRYASAQRDDDIWSYSAGFTPGTPH